jgi:hypothetical protein
LGAMRRESTSRWYEYQLEGAGGAAMADASCF